MDEVGDFLASFFRVVHSNLIALLVGPLGRIHYAAGGVDAGVLGDIIGFFGAVLGLNSQGAAGFVNAINRPVSGFNGPFAHIFDANCGVLSALLRVADDSVAAFERAVIGVECTFARAGSHIAQALDRGSLGVLEDVYRAIRGFDSDGFGVG